MSDVLTMILAGGEGKRLMPLTTHRAKPAVPFAGRYRIIDFVLSNFINSGFYKIKILTQYKSDSLNKHIMRGYRFSAQFRHYIEPVPAQMRTGPDWFKGSADAIYQNLNIITDENPEYCCVFGADHIYKMDVRQMLDFHIVKGADATIAAVPVPLEKASAFGVMEVDKDWRLVGFEEKPANPKPMPTDPNMALVSMGNYIFSVESLLEEILADNQNPDSVHDFGKSIIPAMLATRKVFIYDFTSNVVPGMGEKERGYWRDVGDLDSYFETSMDLVNVTPIIDIHNRQWPIHTYTVQGPPAKFVFADERSRRVGLATDSLVSEGVIVSGGHIDRSVISPFVRINSYSEIDECILLEGVDVGRYARLRRCIIDKFVRVPAHMEIGYNHKLDRQRGFTVTESGLTVIPKNTRIEE